MSGPTARRGKPSSQPRPQVFRSFAAETEFGPCETDGCDRMARAICPKCAGEHCLSHTAHPGHKTAIDTADS